MQSMTLNIKTIFAIFLFKIFILFLIFINHQLVRLYYYTMKQTQETRSKSKYDHHRKNSVINVNALQLKIHQSIPLTMQPKSGLKSIGSARIGSSRPESKQQSHLNTRKQSIQQPRKQSIGKIGMTSRDLTKKQHTRTNSIILKKSTKKNFKKCFNVDISKIVESKPPNEIQNPKKQLSRIDFNFQYIIGKGGFGKVWSVQQKKNHKIYAMKQMLKSKIIQKKSIQSVLNERQLLEKLKHPFIVNMSYAFQDRESLYLVMDLLVGGDLRYYMGRRRKFKQSQSKFFIACIILGLEYLHLNNIIHRDIKPQNLVFDQRGYLRITDLGIARAVRPNNAADTSGTPGYMAPQVMCRQDHSFPVDYYAVGIIAYELMMGRRPYNGRDRKQIRDQILSKQVQVNYQQPPKGWSLQAVDFVNRMIQRKIANRLGSEHGVLQIKEHPWFKGFPWSKLLKKTLEAAFIPQSIAINKDYRQQISESSQQDEQDRQNKLLLRRKSIEDLFEGYGYYCKQKKQEKILPTTSNTNNSATQQKQSKKIKNPTKNNFFKF